MRRTKIVCTLGPASSSPEVIGALVSKGMDVARLNCSHGTHEQLASLVKNVREASDQQARPIAIVLDLQGPKLRIGSFPDGPITIKAGEKIKITTEKDTPNTRELLSTTYAALAKDVKVGDPILIDDGKVELKVLSTNEKEVECEVIYGGELSNKKGMNLPGTQLSIPALTEKDKDDLLYGLELKVDYIALSFVRKPSDVRDVQNMIRANKSSIPVIAKIEKPEAIHNIDDIIAVADGIMIARGDMAVEVSPEAVPSIQKKIIYKCNSAGIPVILATQMLESMTNSPRPTRAEASDVANGVFDGASALMLSAESASGKYPTEAVQIMTDIISRAEMDKSTLGLDNEELPPVVSIADAIEHCASILAEESDARAICCITNSGKAAQALSKFRPSKPIFVLTDQKEALQKLALIWGVKGILIPSITTSEDYFTLVEKTVVQWWNTYLSHVFRPLSKGDILIVTAGLPTETRTKTNAVKVCVIN